MEIIKPNNYRIESLDLLRGLVMVIMALDHARDFLHNGANPTDLATTTSILFFTRWITHFCAPVFVFLAGTSAYLSGSKKNNKNEVAIFLFKRGAWLILLELTIITFAWTFDYRLRIHVIQVIWAIGFSMVCLSFLTYLPLRVLAAIGLIIVAGHNLLDPIKLQGNSLHAFLWYLFHQRNLVFLSPNCVLFIIYPVLPWIGLMILGYCFGFFYRHDYPATLRKKWLLILGLSLTLLFILLRYVNSYGDMNPWLMQQNNIYTVLSFLNTTKYPPSLLYLLMTMGPALLFLYFAEGIKNKVATALTVYGKVPLFYYVIHLYLLHLLSLVYLFVSGKDLSLAVMIPSGFGPGVIRKEGLHLWQVYVVWITVVVLLYWPCKYYANYKAKHRGKWWLSYL